MEGRRLVFRDLRFTVLKAIVLLTLLGALASGCSTGDGGSPGTVAVEKEGTFLDSVVEGLEFSTATQSGLTDETGTFTYLEGETITFSIGAVILGSGTAKPTMSPVDLVADAVDETDPTVVNICRFLQSLDVDGNIDETITISSEIRDALQDVTPLDFTQSTDAFTNDPDVQSIFDTLNSLGVFETGDRTLRSAEEASAHLHDTLWEGNTTIVVKTPNGGEAMVVGGSYEITWNASERIEEVTILLSQDSGSTWNEASLVESTPNDGSYTWSSIPSSAVGTTNRIRIVDVASSTCYDDSNDDFTVLDETEAPTIEVVSPNGGEEWMTESSYEITWSADLAIENVAIELSLDAGETFTSIIAESTPNDGVYIWRSIPLEAVGKFDRLRISDAEDSSVYDVSNASFTVVESPTIEVVSPNGGEQWKVGTEHEITWSASTSIDSVTILLSQDGAETWNETPIVESTPNDGSYTWSSIPPEAEGSSCRIRIADASDEGIYDDSESDFTIIRDEESLTLAELWQMILDSTAPDSDGDSLPDDIEEMLGTDPDHPDTDRDGVWDFSELFGAWTFTDYDLIPDLDNDGTIAPLDSDDNGDGEHDGDSVDSDGDGIPDYLEYYGYTYDWTTGQYSPWDDDDVKSDPTVTYFKTDPLQVSTDQDPYSDSTEVTGILMDVAVEHPGDLPMVPAYPDIVVKLVRYEVTLNADITTSTGKSLWEEETWATATEESHTHTEETSWQQSVSVSVSIGDVFGAGAEASYSYGESYADSTTTGTVTSSGGSTMETTDWQTAKSTNPTEAAHIKLYLKAYNYGTACASTIIPTLTLRIGEKNIATFEAGNAQINMLEPGAVYPADLNTYWVVDTVDTGAGVEPIALTIDELRALETGAPVDLVVTQVSAEVLTMDEEGHWESAGTWSEYMARVKSVCARLFFDIGDGNVIDYLVYSDDDESSPTVTLRDALLWVAGAKEEGGEQKITYFDRINGGQAEASLEGWSLCLDGDTWEMNTLQEGDNILDAVLGPDTTVIFKAPVAEDEPPTIHYAYLDEGEGFVSTFVSDYRGISMVEFIEDLDADPLVTHEMAKDEGTGFYSYILDSGYALTGSEGIRVSNLAGVTLEQTLEVIPDVSGVYPVIESVKLDLNTRELTARVMETWGVETAGVYCEIIGDPDYQKVPMTSMGDGEWTLEMPCDIYNRSEDMIIYATNVVGNEVTSAVTEKIDYIHFWIGQNFNLDEGEALDFETYSTQAFEQQEFYDQSVYDLYCLGELEGGPDNSLEVYLVDYYGDGCMWYEMPAGIDFECLTRDDLEAYEPLMNTESISFDVTAGTMPDDYGKTIIFLTYDGHYVKLTFHYSDAVTAYAVDWFTFRNPEEY